MINYIERGTGLHQAINDAGYHLLEKNGTWISSNDEAVQAIIDSYDPLPEAKTEATGRIILEASKLVAAIYPFINPEKEEAIGLYNFTLDLYLLIKPQAREPLTGRLLAFQGIYNTAISKIAEVNALTDWEAVEAYDASVGW